MLREFFMERWLESYRMRARFNLGESGHRARSVRELVTLSGVCEERAARQFLETSLCDSPNWGRADLRAQVARLHPGAQIENVLVTTGTSEALFLLFRALRPKKVALVVPAFQLLYEIPESLGADIIPLPLQWDDNAQRFVVPWGEWMNVLRGMCPDAVVINHPHNPSGVTLSQAQLGELQSVCEEIEAWLIGDEHYRFLSAVDEGSLLGPTLYRPSQKIFVTGSFVKCTGTPGLRIGWCIGPTNILEKMQNEKNYTTHTVSPLSEWLATVVLENLQSPLWQELRSEWCANQKALADFLVENRNDFVGVSPAGGLVGLIARKDCQSESRFQAWCESLLMQGIFLLPLTSMEAARWTNPSAPSPFLNGFAFRIGLGAQPADFLLALEVLRSANGSESFLIVNAQDSI